MTCPFLTPFDIAGPRDRLQEINPPIMGIDTHSLKNLVGPAHELMILYAILKDKGRKQVEERTKGSVAIVGMGLVGWGIYLRRGHPRSGCLA